MKKLLLLLILCTSSIYAQVGIGTDTPNPSSQLEIKSSNRGVLIPQVALTSKTDQTTINAGNLESLLVYNTSTNETLNPGYYYWFQGNWQRLTSDSDLPDFIVLWDVVNNQFTYIDQNGDIQIIDISDLETLTFLGLNVDGHTLEYTDEDGVVTSIDLEQVIKNFETITTLTANGDGTYTFTNEAGQVTVIDVIGDVVTNIQNQGDIYNEIINIIAASGTDVFEDLGDGTFKHTAVDGTEVIFNANTTSMQDNGDGTYVFTNANGDSITVDVIGDVVTNIQNQGDIYNEIINIIAASGTDVFEDLGDGTFKHTAVDGTEVIFNANTTSMQDNGDGTYVFTNANGDSITVDVINDVVTNIQNQGDIYNEIINIISASGTDVFEDLGDGTFKHTAVDGTEVIFNANTTSMQDNGDGTYVFTNANGDSITVDVIGDVVTNIQNQGDIYNEIINIIAASGTDVFEDLGDGTFKHTAVDGTEVIFNANTTSMQDNGDGTYVFTNANGDSITVDVIGDVVTNIQNQGDIYNEIINIIAASGTDVFEDLGDGTFKHTAVDGTEVIFNANTTSMQDNGDGTYVFTNANGDSITVDVIGDVVTNIQNQGDIYNEIINIIAASGTDVFEDLGDGTFKHTAVDGTEVIFNANTTSMQDNGDGTYVFTNANGDSITVDVIGDVVTNIQNQGDIYNEIINIIAASGTDVFEDLGDGTFKHTAVDGTEVIFNANTTSMQDNGDGTYVFTNANGDSITVDVINDVVTNIQNQGDIYNEIINIIAASGTDVFEDLGDGTFKHTAVDGTEVIFNANTTSMQDNGDGTYVFTNANGDSITVDVIGDVVTNIQNQGDIYNEIINIIAASGTDVFEDLGDGTFKHTAVDGTEVIFNANTTSMQDNGDGTYVFTNANGDSITVDVIGDVVTNIQNQGDIYNEIINIIAASGTDVFEDLGDGTFKHTAVDGTEVIFNANTTSMQDNGDGTYVFTNANGDSI